MKFNSKITIFLLVLFCGIALTGCHNKADNFVNNFKSFVDNVSKKYVDYTEADWKKKEDAFAKKMDEYESLESKLTKEQDDTIQKNIKKFNDLKAKWEKDYNTLPIFNVYIENSGSMDGYVNGATHFETSVYNYLSDIKISELTDSLNLFYINSRAIPFGSDIADFIEKLEPSTFRERGGDRKTSDISNILKTILNSHKSDKTVSILVTDGIFSPGKYKRDEKGELIKDESRKPIPIDATEYLTNQEIGIKTSFAEHLKKHKNTAVMVYQLESKFNGKYYDKLDNPTQINEVRPFYIWIIGDKKELKKLREKIPDRTLQERSYNHWLNVFTIMPCEQEIKYCISGGTGKDFKFDKENPKVITKLDCDKRGSYKFYVKADFSKMLLESSYIEDTHNYQNSSEFKLKEVKPDNASSLYTHKLIFEANNNQFKGKSINVKLKSKLPEWIEKTNDQAGDGPVKNKTYGIKQQLNGVYNAFTFNGEHATYTEIKIDIK